MASKRVKGHRPTGPPTVAKVPTGIRGLDDVLNGGVPKGRATLVAGTAGAGKTMLATEFLVRGAQQGEAGVFVSFEEPHDDLVANAASLGFDLARLEEDGLLAIDHVGDGLTALPAGEYDLEGLFVRIEACIERIGAKRLVIDTLEALFVSTIDTGLIRTELRRLIAWLKAKGITSMVTAESTNGSVTRHGVEEFVADCVISLDHRAEAGAAMRRIQVRKYRGSSHAASRFPFYIDDQGIAVLPLPTESLVASASTERISTGIEGLDDMFGGGVYRGSTMLVSGTSGTGKTSIAAAMVDAACARGEFALYVSFEESPGQLIRNMRSIGLRLDRWEKAGLLRLSCHRPSGFGVEHQFGELQRLVAEQKPDIVVVDPVSAFEKQGDQIDTHAILLRQIDFLKAHGITAVLTSLTTTAEIETSNAAISSLVDSWIYVQVIQGDAERNRGLFVLKSRGMAHSHQVREFLMSDHGISLRDVYVGSRGVLTGSARVAREAQDRADQAAKQEELERLRTELLEREKAFAAERAAAERRIAAIESQVDELGKDREEQRRRRTGTGRS